MNVTMEQVEKVRACTGATFEQARAALEQCGGSVLDAVILLERTGGAGHYSTRPDGPEPGGESRRRPTGRDVREAARKLMQNCTAVYFTVWREERMTCRVPLLAAAALLIVEPWLTVALLLVGMCLGYRVHLDGRGTEGWGSSVNRVIDQTVDTVSDAMGFLKQKKK